MKHGLFTSLGLSLAMIGLLVGVGEASGPIEIPQSTLAISLPDELKPVVIPANAPNMLLHYADRGDTVAVQAIRGTAGLDGKAMAKEYETQIKPAFRKFEQRSSRTEMIAGREVLHRVYDAVSGRQNVVVDVMFLPNAKQAMIVHIIATSERHAALAPTLYTLQDRQPVAPAKPDKPISGKVPGTKFPYTAPSGWTVQTLTEGSGSVTIISPDGNAAINLTGVKLEKNVEPKSILDSVMTEMSKPLVGGWILAANTSNDGEVMQDRYRRYTGMMNGTPAAHVLFARHQEGVILVINGLYPMAQSESHGRVVQDVINQSRLPEAKPVERPRSPHERRPVEPKKNPVVTTPPVQPPQSSWQQINEPGMDFSFEAPLGWSSTRQGNKVLVVAPADSSFAGLSFTLQKLPRRAGGTHADLATSAATARSLVRQISGARIVVDQASPVAGQTGHTIGLTWMQSEVSQRMMQRIIETPEAIYWLGYSGPEKLVIETQLIQDHAFGSMQSHGKSPATTISTPGKQATGNPPQLVIRETEKPGEHPGLARPAVKDYPIPSYTRKQENTRKVPGYIRKEIDYYQGETRVAQEVFYDEALNQRYTCRGDEMHGWSLSLNKDGEIRDLRLFADGKQDGPHLIWTDKGLLSEIRHFKHGERDGRWMRWIWDTTVPYVEEHYQAGKLHGISRQWRDQNISREAMYVDGKLHGDLRDYDRKGNLIRETQYAHGKREGLEKTYQEGKLVATQRYRDGNPVND